MAVCGYAAFHLGRRYVTAVSWTRQTANERKTDPETQEHSSAFGYSLFRSE